jgi:hypothetical protein
VQKVVSRPSADYFAVGRRQKELTILPDGHIQLPTLLKEGQPNTHNNYEFAKNKLFSLLGLKSMTLNNNLLRDYGEVIKKWEKSGYIERVVDPNTTRLNLWYWAHFLVIKSEEETTKIRPVFDGAAKFRGICINDYIMTGPSVMNELVAVVYRFQQYDYAMTGNVEEMFLQVRVPPSEKDYLRFLWYENNAVVIYRYRVHL